MNMERILITEKDIKNWVDEIITPEYADSEGKRLCQLLYAVADETDDQKFHLAETAAKHAFSKTMAFDEAFQEFAKNNGNDIALVSQTNITFLKPN